MQHFARIDRKGAAFRYPGLLPEGLEVIDIGSLANDVRAAVQLLEGAADGLEEIIQDATAEREPGG